MAGEWSRVLPADHRPAEVADTPARVPLETYLTGTIIFLHWVDCHLQRRLRRGCELIGGAIGGAGPLFLSLRATPKRSRVLPKDNRRKEVAGVIVAGGTVTYQGATFQDRKAGRINRIDRLAGLRYRYFYAACRDLIGGAFLLKYL